ncbi:hypothetical protein [Phyllobacterium chamaecytisi]|uniref:hypothetical protein n=1 Tax=Phyllobacterium chamaecytisi TaxID=2876082 RepID=UPI001CCB1EF8|nr:hypothetical protein [Phyllobacterium sp. KW56]MBZ9600716.1 hypothetical protein [Phyllobacterium sp. KW56]
MSTVRIPLTRGFHAVVDADDFHLVEGYIWQASYRSGLIYASRREGSQTIYMHRVILGITDERLVDHADKNGLNNRRYNLREATRPQNIANSGPHKTNASGFKGVSFDKERRLWKAQINAKLIGRFASPEEAALAYDDRAFAAWGVFAYLNQDHCPNLCAKRMLDLGIEDLIAVESEVA